LKKTGFLVAAASCCIGISPSKFVPAPICQVDYKKVGKGIQLLDMKYLCLCGFRLFNGNC
jgi:hypothetical protein